MVITVGVSATDKSVRIPSAPIVDTDSVSDPSSPNYLGRVKGLEVVVEGIQDVADANVMNRRMAAATMGRRLKGSVEIARYNTSLAPNVRARLYTKAGALRLDGWIKRSAVVIDQHNAETMRLELDTIWESEAKGI